MTERPGSDLPWIAFGRQVRPYSLAVSLASSNVAYLIVSGRSAWGGLDMYSLVLAGAAITGTVLLWVGFWARSLPALRHGLALTAAVFAARGAYIGVTSANWATASLSFCFAIASGGGYLLEANYARRVRARLGGPPRV